MKKFATGSDSPMALRALAESDDEAACRLFCRRSSALREWLWEEFSRKPKTRANRATLLDKEESPADAALFSTENWPLHIETAALRQKVPARIYGGLTWSEVEDLAGIMQLSAR